MQDAEPPLSTGQIVLLWLSFGIIIGVVLALNFANPHGLSLLIFPLSIMVSLVLGLIHRWHILKVRAAGETMTEKTSSEFTSPHDV